MSVSTMISRAEKDIGLREPNYIQEWYEDRNGAAYDYNFPWCNAGITRWSFDSGNYEAVCFGRDFAYTVGHAARFRAKGRWTRDVRGIRRGDIVFFDWGGSDDLARIDHVGLVTSVKGGYVYTIEANTADMCKRRVRTASTIAGYGRPAYTSGGKVTPPPKHASSGLSGYGHGGGKGMTSVRGTRSQQRIVNAAGYSPKLVEDGVMGPKTVAGVKWYQGELGIKQDGDWGPNTEAAHKKRAGGKGGSSTPSRPGTRAPDWPGRMLTQPPVRKSSECRTWQARMRERGWSIAVDSWYGPKSERVCRQFQAEKGLKKDGIVGPKTWRASWTAPIT
ncbi:peptidoglycan-binding protein [Streptomonospora algeriensis]|uniref:Peptidoglycan-binding protein n=1 Tax=Streptomonospora algeriensis TaxID=995084 RepID=A0ABW3BCJ9_9ACTN